MPVEPRNQMDALVEGRTAECAGALIQENAAMEGDVHAQIGKLLQEWSKPGVVYRPAVWNHFDAANAQFVVAASRLLHHQIRRSSEVASGEARVGVQHGEGQ